MDGLRREGPRIYGSEPQDREIPPAERGVGTKGFKANKNIWYRTAEEINISSAKTIGFPVPEDDEQL